METFDFAKITKLTSQGVILWKKQWFGRYKTKNFDLNIKLISNFPKRKIYVNGKEVLGPDRDQHQYKIADLAEVIDAYNANIRADTKEINERIVLIEKALKDLE